MKWINKILWIIKSGLFGIYGTVFYSADITQIIAVNLFGDATEYFIYHQINSLKFINNMLIRIVQK